MKSNKANLLPGAYNDHLAIISGIKFTPREIDVIACLLGGRTTKTICQFLSIEEKTVETHKHNIMRKLDANSKEGIINFIEKSDKLPSIKQHYLDLLSQVLFEKSIQEALNLPGKKGMICSIIYWREQEQKTPLVNQLEKHLKLAGFKLSLEARENYRSLNHLIHNLESQVLDCTIYMVSAKLLEQFRSDESKGKQEIFPFIQKASQNPGSVIFLLNQENAITGLPSEIQNAGYVNFEEQEDYYLSVFEILKKMMPDKNLDKIIADFRKQHRIIHSSSETLLTQIWPEINASIGENFRKPFFASLSKRGKRGLFLGGILFVSSICFLSYNLNDRKTIKNTQPAKSQEIHLARSDLPLPAENVLLKRTKILTQIDESLKGSEGIRAVALVGIGGVGKTTLARQYARIQRASVVWEINAETNGSLMGSFEAFAYALCQTENERTLLNSLKALENSDERREKIVFFIKNKLKLVSSWLLIFDNVEKFTDIQKYYPSDFTTWGEGKVILTTRDSNIKNNNSINDVISIRALEDEEKLALFVNIIRKGDGQKFTAAQIEGMQRFLSKLPPFPLDISTASYYLKTTDTSYEDYLDHIKEYNKDFELIQENLLKEAGEYTKTRYGIITLSLDKLINTHKDFRDLVLLVSLIDSQNIPIDLLRNHKNDVVVDNFIYHLKNYSFITNESSLHSIPSFSIHRSTQAISLEYLTKTLNLNRGASILHQISHTFERYITKVIDEDDFSKMKALISHAKVFLNHPNLLTNLNKCSVQSELGEIYFYLGDYEKSVKLLEENRELLKNSRDKNHTVIARTFEYLGNAYRVLGDYEKAKMFLEQGLTTYQKYFPENHIRIAWALGHLGIVYREMGNYEKAKNLISKSFTTYVRSLSENHIRSCWALATLGTVDIELGNYNEAKDTLNKSLILYQKYYPQNHIRIAWILAHLGIAYRELGDYERAKTLLEESLSVYKTYFFGNHIEVVRALRGAGKVYLNLGDYKKAKTFFEESLAICEKTYGKNHIDFSLGLVNLGEFHLLEGNIIEAEKSFKKAAELLRQKNHPTYYIPLEQLAELYIKKSGDVIKNGSKRDSQSFTAQAISYLQQALEIVKPHYPKQSPHILRIQSKLDKLKF